MNKIFRCYIDTSVWNFAFADHVPDKKSATLRFFNQCRQGKFECYVSELALLEIGRTPDSNKRENLLALIKELSPIVVARDPRADDLVKKYIDEGIIPIRAENDAVHIALAVAGDLDIIVSWNMDHMVKLKTRLGVNAVNKLLGFKEIEIATPEEVLISDEGY